MAHEIERLTVDGQIHVITAVLRKAQRIAWDDGTWLLRGQCFNDIAHRFPDGHFIRTTLVQEEIAPNVFRTKNSIYRVEDWFPPSGATENTGPD
jgi:hypothetical protein